MNLEEKNNEGLLLLQQGSNEEALKIFEGCFAAEKAPVFAYNAGLALYRMDRFEEAKNGFQRAIKLSDIGQYKEAEAMFGMCCLELKDYATAVCALDGANTPDAESVSGQIDLGRLELGLGFCSYEARHKTPSTWDGTESLVGKTILVEGTEGLGDQIFFARWIPWLKTLGAAYIDVLVSEPLVSLFEMNFAECGVKVVSSVEAEARYDFVINLGSLGYLLNVELGTIPAAPYIKRQWNKPCTTKIGLTWSGNPLHVNDKNRSIPLEKFAPLLGMKDVEFVSLQKDVRASDMNWLRGKKALQHLHITNFIDTVWAISNQTLIITVDTAVANLAGAMGHPTWVLVPYTCDWRWTFEGEKTPWYPSVRVFRQGEDRRWEPVVAQVIEELKKLGENDD